MASACPKCAVQISEDFGIISCPGCGAILSIDFDGNVSLSDSDEHAALGAESETPSGMPDPEPVAEFQFEDDQSVQPVENHDSQELQTVQPVENIESEESVGEFQENWLGEEPVNASPPAPEGPLDFADVIDFANSVELDNSPLVYAFRIEGIDHKDIRKKVMDVLSDIRLNIHIKDLIPTIKDGILELQHLSPIRASIIASRLREEAVIFRWRQSVFQSDVPQAESGT